MSSHVFTLRPTNVHISQVSSECLLMINVLSSFLRCNPSCPAFFRYIFLHRVTLHDFTAHSPIKIFFLHNPSEIIRADRKKQWQLEIYDAGYWIKYNCVFMSLIIVAFTRERESYLFKNLIPIMFRKLVQVFRISSLLCEHWKSMHVVLLERCISFWIDADVNVLVHLYCSVMHEMLWATYSILKTYHLPFPRCWSFLEVMARHMYVSWCGRVLYC